MRVWDEASGKTIGEPMRHDVLLLADLAEAACGSVLQTSSQTEILKLLPPDQVRADRKIPIDLNHKPKQKITAYLKNRGWSTGVRLRRTTHCISLRATQDA